MRMEKPPKLQPSGFVDTFYVCPKCGAWWVETDLPSQEEPVQLGLRLEE